jgi:hypothetical protein
MDLPISYSCVALLDICDPLHVSIITISILQDKTILSGAWELDSSDIDGIKNLTENSLVLVLGDEVEMDLIVGKDFLNKVSLNMFLREAQDKAKSSAILFDEYVDQHAKNYAAYMSITPSERKSLPKISKKKLTPPTFHNWPGYIDLDHAGSYLRSIKKLATVKGTPKEWERVITAARLVAYFVDMWKLDEVERNGKIYLKSEDSRSQILPDVWLKKRILVNYGQ